MNIVSAHYYIKVFFGLSFCVFACQPINGMEPASVVLKSIIRTTGKEKKGSRAQFAHTVCAMNTNGEKSKDALKGECLAQATKDGFNLASIRSEIRDLLADLNEEMFKNKGAVNSIAEIGQSVNACDHIELLKLKAHSLRDQYGASEQLVGWLYDELQKLKTFPAYSHEPLPDIQEQVKSCKKWCNACVLGHPSQCGIVLQLNKLRRLLFVFGNAENLPEQFRKLMDKFNTYSLEDLKQRINNINDSFKFIPMKLVYKEQLLIVRDMSQDLADLINEQWSLH